ncbi:hypothetical protein [Streptomyces subrutilus]|uniref:ATP-dependent DNA ligase n=1 Tax=Streptomyces subrutilus TaxID=36818 RepID=UPI001FCA946C|nr:hypothetical protein [Streptomyces subrutilus]
MGRTSPRHIAIWLPKRRTRAQTPSKRQPTRGLKRNRIQESANPLAFAFDALQVDGAELLTLSYAERRRRLDVLFSARALTAPWTLCPMTIDPAKAREWLEDWTDVSGVEGIVVKKLSQRYLPGSRAWTKIRPVTPPKRSSAPSPAPSHAPNSSSSAAMTRPAASTPSAAPSHCAPTRHASSPSTSHWPASAIHGRARSSPLPGAPVTSSTPPWSGRTSSRRSAPTLPWTAAVSTATQSGTCACAWTRPSMTCPGSAGARPRPPGERRLPPCGGGRARPEPRGRGRTRRAREACAASSS